MTAVVGATAASRAAHGALRRFAESDAAVVTAFLWAAAEATVQPVIPDAPLCILALASRRALRRLLPAALAGMLLGGCLTLAVAELWPAGAVAVLERLPLVHPGQLQVASHRMAAEGVPRAFLGQPWSGIPFKVWAVAAGARRADPLAVAAAFAVGRSLRIAGTTLTVALLAAALHRRGWLQDAFLPLLAGGVLFFTAGFAQVVVR